MTMPELRIQRIPRFRLESGVELRNVEQAYLLEGVLSPSRDNLIIAFHSLTGGPQVRSWWPGMVGAGRVLDTDRYAVLSPNLLGSCYGTTGLPATNRPVVTPRDMVRLVGLLVDALGAESVALATGGSLGGMVAMEWAATFPDRTRATVVFAAPAAHTAQAIGFGHLQRRALDIGGEQGLALARMIAMMTYRTAAEFGVRFGRDVHEDGRLQAQSYLDYQGEKLMRRFDAESYRTLIDAMDAHDVGRGRGGVAAALRAYSGRLTGVGIPGDLLYDSDEVRSWTQEAGAAYREIVSRSGHDAFLLESEQVFAILADALAAAGLPAPEMARKP